MTKQEIIDRIAQIESAIQSVAQNHAHLTTQLQHQANTHTTLTGQKAECQFWLADIEKKEAEELQALASDSNDEDIPQ